MFYIIFYILIGYAMSWLGLTTTECSMIVLGLLIIHFLTLANLTDFYLKPYKVSGRYILSFNNIDEATIVELLSLCSNTTTVRINRENKPVTARLVINGYITMKDIKVLKKLKAI